MSTSSSSSGGIGFCGLLTIVFIVLKLCGVAPVATWGWIWVLSPLWIGFLFIMLIIGIIFGIAAIIALANK